MMLVSPLLGLWLRMPPVGARNEDAEVLADPEVRLSLTGRSGPLVVEIEYRVDQESARAFHNVMQEVQLSRQRNGAYGWSIARDIADPELWTERYHCPTWLDYLRQRNRIDAIRARAASARDGISPRPRSGAGPPHAGAAVRIGALEGRHAGPRRNRSIAGDDRPRAAGTPNHQKLLPVPRSAEACAVPC